MNVNNYIDIIKKNQTTHHKFIIVLVVLSLITILFVFWRLKLVGITMVGEAFCGLEEHTHNESCITKTLICEVESNQEHIHTDECYETTYICEKEEHTHQPLCYCDINADIETSDIWENTMFSVPINDNLTDNLIAIAKSQIGYKESELNFQVDVDGVRHGYTRYGEWYGNPYGDWSAMFVSFCLHYAQITDVPINSGVETMRIQWQNANLYQLTTDYTPTIGDIAFLDKDQNSIADSIAIIIDIQDDNIILIEGDCNNSVTQTSYSSLDTTIMGYGTINQLKLENKTMMLLSSSNANVSNIKDYIESQDNGSFIINLLNTDNTEIQKNQEGKYVVLANQDYKLTIGMYAPDGILSGTYYYQLPDGFTLSMTSGEFIINGKNIGSWNVDTSNNITFNFNENSNEYTDKTISLSTNISFLETKMPIVFDGNISVIVNPPLSDVENTKVSKWAKDNVENPNPKKIYWCVELTGNKDSNIIGSVITDQILTTDTHHYEQSDMDNGIKFMAFEYNENGECITEHSWKVYPNDLNVTWNVDGWSYTIPKTFKCDWCDKTSSTGNDNWIYYIEYTSTKCDNVDTGYAIYRNIVNIDGDSSEGWHQELKGDGGASIIKQGYLDENGEEYHWNITVTIPGRKDNQEAEYFWHLWDDMKIKSSDGSTLGYPINDINNATVIAMYNGKTISVPSYEDATLSDLFCWECSWSDEIDGIYYGREIDLYCKCDCNKNTCPNWKNDQCSDKSSNGFCKCWTPTEDVVFTFSYTTDAPQIIDKYGGQGAYVRNSCELDQQQRDQNGIWNNILIDNTTAKVNIPGVFKKIVSKEPTSMNDYTATFTITLNEAKLKLNDETLQIHDVMTETLYYIPGTLVILAEDESGNTRTLEIDKDYSIENNALQHTLDIFIVNPNNETYTLNYDATIDIPKGSTNVTYSNSATVTLFGKELTVNSDTKILSEINISAKNYSVTILKTDTNSKPLSNAIFGLFAENGEKISEGTTNQDGIVVFRTSLKDGIILKEHTPFYIMELKAPNGYTLDNTKHWILFCDSGLSCEKCAKLYDKYSNIQRFSVDNNSKVLITNQQGYMLPETGSNGCLIYILSGVSLMIFSLIYGHILMYKKIHS